MYSRYEYFGKIIVSYNVGTLIESQKKADNGKNVTIAEFRAITKVADSSSKYNIAATFLAKSLMNIINELRLAALLFKIGDERSIPGEQKTRRRRKSGFPEIPTPRKAMTGKRVKIPMKNSNIYLVCKTRYLIPLFLQPKFCSYYCYCSKYLGIEC